MSNVLIRGCPGTGKTFIARAMAYYMCMKKLTESEAIEKDPYPDIKEIDRFVSESGQCEYIQVHPSMEFDDIVYGLEIKVSGGLNISYAEKRIMSLCNKANGRPGKYCVILDDINRANASNLMGNLLYAMEYRNQDIDLPDGNRMSIPSNVIFIFTENTLDVGDGLDLAIRRRMTYLKELSSSKNVLQKYYSGALNGAALRLIIDIYDRVKDYIYSYFENEPGRNPANFIPGHGMFMVERKGTVHYILDSIRQKIRLQVGPHLKNLYLLGLIKIDPEPFIEQIIDTLNVGIAGICPIASIKKKLIKSNTYVTGFSLHDSRDYYINTIVPNKCTDYRGMMECILDALIMNRILPHDVLMSALLKNTNIAYIDSLHAPMGKAAYIVEKSQANRFMYQTKRKGKITGTHAYYTLDAATTGRWASQSDTEEYVVEYLDGRNDEEYIPLSGFRNHGFNPDKAQIYILHNTCPIMSAVHILLQNYYEIIKTNIELIMTTEPEYVDLFNLIILEEKYLEAVKWSLKKRTPGVPTGDPGKVAYYGKKIANLSLLWYGVGDKIRVDANKFQMLLSGKTKFSIGSYEDIYVYNNATSKDIEIKGVLKMVDLKDYQKIMENIGIRQMIFQGPPGTSKTFESKRFVLSQLNSSAQSLSKQSASQEDISTDLDNYKLTDADYADPLHSTKLITGGWDLVQFHPSYGYEDFIRGIEVKIPAGSTTPSYESVNRILGKIAEFAKVSADNAKSRIQPKFYLIIDEINRANLATVFGELIYGLEYRNSKVSTPYEVKEKATGVVTKDIIIGKNLYILGTMNTADKSIDAIDYAIRRRFIFIDSPADRNIVLNCYRNISGNADDKSIELFLFDAVQRIFDEPRFFNDEYQKNDVRIGHTYFLRDRKRGYMAAIIEHFVFQVVPILREYLKDGILDVTEDLIPLEHSEDEIFTAGSDDKQITMLSENIMLYIKEFGNLNKSNVQIDNAYIGAFIENLGKAFSY